MAKQSWSYAKAGVDIDAGNEAVERIKSLVQTTIRPEVLSEPGGFAGLFSVPAHQYLRPVLVAGCDGVGTKLKIAFAMEKHDTIGIDCVAMCVNDILVQGAEPLFFLDYLAVGELVPEQVEQVVHGVVQGCRQAGCALLGGETAEMPGFYPAGEYDLAGFAVGVVEKDNIIAGTAVAAGDVILGLSSSGLHSNGFSLVRKILLEQGRLDLTAPARGIGRPLGEELLEPTRIYVPSILTLLPQVPVKGMAHITGGGIVENIARILPAGTEAVIKAGTWTVPPIFQLIQQQGNVSDVEMLRTFNLGLGFVIIIAAAHTDQAQAVLTAAGEEVQVVGRIITGEPKAVVEGSIFR